MVIVQKKTAKERIYGFIKRKKEVIQQELLYINTHYEVEKKRQINYNHLIDILDELEQEKKIERHLFKHGKRELILIRSKGQP
jgi:hypothetical protein